MTPRIALIDYGSGNLRSVAKSLEAVGAAVIRVPEAPLPTEVDALVLPGVGAFGDCVDQLQTRGLFEEIRNWIVEGRQFLGICLGYQLLFETSEESPGTSGFGILQGSVRRFRGPGLKVPHIGWNQIRWTPRIDTAGLPENPFVYFVHSYYPVPKDEASIAATTNYGGTFASAVQSKNIFATQFHPEKSQQSGLAILRRFVGALP
jgi:glutamine amidotransferase